MSSSCLAREPLAVSATVWSACSKLVGPCGSTCGGGIGSSESDAASVGWFHHVTCSAKLPSNTESCGGKRGSSAAIAPQACCHRESPAIEPLESTSTIHCVAGSG